MEKIGQISVELSGEDAHTKLHLVDDLIRTAQKKHRDTQRKAVTALKDVFVGKLLPKDRPLAGRYANSADFEGLSQQKKQELQEMQKVEANIKTLFKAYLMVLEAGMTDPMEDQRKFFVEILYNLLQSAVEQETRMLKMVLNKLGDVSKKVGARVLYLMQLLLDEHPRMQRIVIREVEQIIFGASTNERTRHYGAVLLSEMQLSRYESDVVASLLKIYFALFQKLLGENHPESRTMRILLTGVRRAFPFSDMKSGELQEHIKVLFTIAACSVFQHRVSALTVLQQIIKRSDGGKEIAQLRSRYFRSLYLLLKESRYNQPETHHLSLFFTMLYQVLTELDNRGCVLAFIHRMLRSCLEQTSGYACAILMLISELTKVHPYIKVSIARNPRARKVAKEKKAKKGGEGTPPPGEMAVFDPVGRDPFHANGEFEAMWALNKLATDSHPSVVKFALTLLSGEHIDYDGDPLEDFSNKNFIQKFMLKKPRARVFEEEAEEEEEGGEKAVEQKEEPPKKKQKKEVEEKEEKKPAKSKDDASESGESDIDFSDLDDDEGMDDPEVDGSDSEVDFSWSDTGSLSFDSDAEEE